MNNELYHFGVLGMKWYVRRYQNYDGTLTPLGKKHYYGNSKAMRDSDPLFFSDKENKHFSKVTDKEFAREYRKTAKGQYNWKGVPNEIAAASKLQATTDVKHTNTIKDSKKELFDKLKPELEFETNHVLQKKFGYNSDNPDFESVHDAWEQYYDAKEKYMKSIGLGEKNPSEKTVPRGSKDSF